MINRPTRTGSMGRMLTIVVSGLLLLMLAAYGGQIAPAAWGAALNGSTPPGTIPPGPIPPAEKAKITVIHAAPFDANVDNTAVDICTETGTLVAGLTDLKYLYNASIVVDPGEYDLKVADAGTNCASERLNLAPFTLTAQQEVVLILTGDGTNQPLDALLLVTDAGAQRLYLPIIAR